MGVGITYGSLRPTVNLHVGPGTNLLCTSLYPVKGRGCNHAIRIKTLKYAVKSPSSAIDKAMLFSQLSDLHVLVNLGDTNNLALTVLVGTSFFDGFVEKRLTMERSIAPIRSCPVAIIENYEHTSDPRAVVQTATKDETSADG